MPSAPSETIRLTIEDRQAIIDATILYCWAIDARDYDRLEDVFTDDVSSNLSSAGLPVSGLTKLKKYIADVLDPLDASQHMISNHVIEEAEEGARSRCYFHAQHIRRDREGGPHYIVAGIYSDLWHKTPVGWRACHRKLEVLWTEGNPAVLSP